MRSLSCAAGMRSSFSRNALGAVLSISPGLPSAPQQLRQLGEVRRHAAGLVLREQLKRDRAAACDPSRYSDPRAVAARALEGAFGSDIGGSPEAEKRYSPAEFNPCPSELRQFQGRFRGQIVVWCGPSVIVSQGAIALKSPTRG